MGGALLFVAIVLLGSIGWSVAGMLELKSLALRILAAYAASWATLVVVVVGLSVPGRLSRAALVVAIALLASGSFAVRLWRGPGRRTEARLSWKEPLADPVVRTLAIAVTVVGVYL